ncbi:hypothetical protein [Lentilactobacillus fungorum]|nr:hypothetical protein [Lentilactobacillus fungorum]
MILIMSGSSGAAPQSGSQSGSAKKAKLPSGSKKPSGKKPTGKSGSAPTGNSSSSGKTYKTVQAYIKSLNKNGTWIKYNGQSYQLKSICDP